MTWNIEYENPIYVDYNYGDDENDGSIKYPLKHIDFAIELSRILYGEDEQKTIVLRHGRH